MIRKEDIIEIGKFQKTHALKGELNAILQVDEDFIDDGNPLIVEMDGIFVPFYPESVRRKGSESFLLLLEGVDSQEKAREFVNKTIYGRRSDLLEYFDDPDEELHEDFIGYTVTDTHHGVIGKIADLDDSTENVLFVVENDSGERIYIPVVDDFILNIDDDRMLVEMDLPEGLVDLNKKSEEDE